MSDMGTIDDEINLRDAKISSLVGRCGKGEASPLRKNYRSTMHLCSLPSSISSMVLSEVLYCLLLPSKKKLQSKKLLRLKSFETWLFKQREIDNW